MEGLLKADRNRKQKPQSARTADYHCNLCDGNDRGLYAKVFRESEDVEAEISDEARQNKGLPCGIKPSGRKLMNTTERTCHSGHGANIVYLVKDSHTHTIKRKRKK